MCLGASINLGTSYRSHTGSFNIDCQLCGQQLDHESKHGPCANAMCCLHACRKGPEVTLVAGEAIADCGARPRQRRLELCSYGMGREGFANDLLPHQQVSVTLQLTTGLP